MTAPRIPRRRTVAAWRLALEEIRDRHKRAQAEAQRLEQAEKAAQAAAAQAWKASELRKRAAWCPTHGARQRKKVGGMYVYECACSRFQVQAVR